MIDDNISINIVINTNSVIAQRDKHVKKQKLRRGTKRKTEHGHSEKPVLEESADLQSDLQQHSVLPANKEVKHKQPDVLDGNPSKKSRKIVQELVVSSLFKSNPEIPIISKQETVGSIKEEIFASETFKDLDLHPFLVKALEEKMKLTQLTAVQKQSIPVILNGHDSLIKSQTGSGKTLAFAVPIVQHLQRIQPPVSRGDGPYAIVILPTRELAQQCFNVFSQLLRPFIRIVPGCIIGGEKRKAEKACIRKGINIVLCTPGRLLDHLENTSSLTLDRLRYLVLDEADRLCDLGYEKKIAEIISTINSRSTMKAQTILLSATLSQGVERMAGISMNNPKRIFLSDDQSLTTEENADDNEQGFSVPNQLEQFFVITPCKLRLVTLAGFILWKCQLSMSHRKMIVFMSTQDSVEFHHQLFNHLLKTVGHQDLSLLRLHGDMEQKERAKVFQTFSGSTHGILLCTDVAARGLDLANVHWIVQFSCPSSEADYIHRIGRTARAGAKGQSLIFLMPSEVEYVQVLNKHKISLEEMKMEQILNCLAQIVADVGLETDDGTRKRPPPRDTNESATYLQLYFENVALEKTGMLNLARRGYQSYIRGYATYPRHLKPIFRVQDLHLGHVAKTFGLREAPMGIGLRVSVKEKKQHKKKDMPKKKNSQVLEFAAGFSKSKPKPVRKKKNKGMKK